LIFGIAVFSPMNVGVSSSRTDPSQPYVVSHSSGINYTIMEIIHM